jgi:hypothetical protein
MRAVAVVVVAQTTLGAVVGRWLTSQRRRWPSGTLTGPSAILDETAADHLVPGSSARGRVSGQGDSTAP